VKDKLDLILSGGKVKRYHTRDTIHSQNNAEHSFGVASIVAIISEDCSKDLLLHALWHDVHECKTGDIPAPAKWRWPQLKNVLTKIEKELESQISFMPKISDKENSILKMADCLETIVFCIKEKRFGNTHLDEVISNCQKKIWQINDKFPNANAIRLLHDIIGEKTK